MSKAERLTHMKHALDAAHESRCDCAGIGPQSYDDFTHLIGHLEAKIAELEAAA